MRVKCEKRAMDVMPFEMKLSALMTQRGAHHIAHYNIIRVTLQKQPETGGNSLGTPTPQFFDG